MLKSLSGLSLKQIFAKLRSKKTQEQQDSQDPHSLEQEVQIQNEEETQVDEPNQKPDERFSLKKIFSIFNKKRSSDQTSDESNLNLDSQEQQQTAHDQINENASNDENINDKQSIKFWSKFISLFTRSKNKQPPEENQELENEEIQKSNALTDQVRRREKIKNLDFKKNKRKARRLFTKITVHQQTQIIPLQKLNRGIYSKYLKAHDSFFGQGFKNLTPKRKIIYFTIVLLGTYLVLDLFFPEKDDINFAEIGKGGKTSPQKVEKKPNGFKKPKIDRKTIKKLTDKIVPEEKQEEIKENIQKMAENMPVGKSDDPPKEAGKNISANSQANDQNKKPSFQKLSQDIEKDIKSIENKVNQAITQQNKPKNINDQDKNMNESTADSEQNEEIVSTDQFNQELDKSINQAQDTSPSTAFSEKKPVVNTDRKNENNQQWLDSLDIDIEEYSINQELVEDTSVVKNRIELKITDQILEDLEKELNQAKSIKEDLAYTPPPNYQLTGSYLVYNCTGKHWACLDLPNFLQCQKNFRSISSLEQKFECIPMKETTSKQSCAQRQQTKIHQIEVPNSCSQDQFKKL